MTTEIATVIETATGTGIVTEIAGGVTLVMTGGTIEEMTDATTEGMIDVKIGAGMIVDVPVLATVGIASPRHLYIPQKSQSQPLLLRMRNSKLREQNWKHGKRRERLKKPWAKQRLKLWHLQERLLKVSKFGSTAEYCDFIT
jgi:hypothetical protein